MLLDFRVWIFCFCGSWIFYIFNFVTCVFLNLFKFFINIRWFQLIIKIHVVFFKLFLFLWCTSSPSPWFWSYDTFIGIWAISFITFLFFINFFHFLFLAGPMFRHFFPFLEHISLILIDVIYDTSISCRMLIKAQFLSNWALISWDCPRSFIVDQTDLWSKSYELFNHKTEIFAKFIQGFEFLGFPTFFKVNLVHYFVWFSK